ncbi:MAG: GIY-YIG nuclease family protein, partial [Syntrophomonadaceae bacterium]|nr:GIY-YIG nuclease family protein [Syntrophomonadaceae bacterium]
SNSIIFQLNMGSHPNKDLQNDYKTYGADQFEVTVLEQIEYEENDAKTDYSDDLKLLKMIWTDKLMQEGIKLY